MPLVGANAAPRPVLARLAESHQVGWKILRPDSESDAEGIAKLLLRERLDAAVFMKDDRSTGWFDGAEKASQETFRWKAIINRDDYFNPSIGAGLVSLKNSYVNLVEGIGPRFPVARFSRTRNRRSLAK